MKLIRWVIKLFSSRKKTVLPEVKEEVAIASLLIRPGHSAWVFDSEEKVVRKVDNSDYDDVNGGRQLRIKKGRVYVSALNEKSAANKIIGIMKSNIVGGMPKN